MKRSSRTCWALDNRLIRDRGTASCIFVEVRPASAERHTGISTPRRWPMPMRL
ncbi:MAG TPA: hypothetical protein VMT12_07520 [Syntrophales bacterium]|nr:hypothetical protein [Syntrophales bacterium]